jgi:ribosomal protein S18 acetylase RimI-like enzyme
MVDIFLTSVFMHKGLGSSVMKAFLRNYVFSGCLFTAEQCTIGPEPKNVSAIRMYEKSGFHWVKTIQMLSEDEPEYIMVIHKKNLQ